MSSYSTSAIVFAAPVVSPSVASGVIAAIAIFGGAPGGPLIVVVTSVGCCDCGGVGGGCCWPSSSAVAPSVRSVDASETVFIVTADIRRRGALSGDHQ